MSECPVAISDLSQELRRFVDPASPPPMRMMAARSLVPLGPGDLVTALYVLCFDPDENVVQAAQDSLAKLPDEVIKPALQQPMPGPVLDYLARALAGSPEHVELLVLNKALPDETMYYLAQVADERQLEIIAANQERLLRYPAIIEALYYNPKARQSTVDRVIELAVRSGLVLDGIPAFKELAAALGYDLEGEPDVEPEVQGGEEVEQDDEVFAALLAESVAKAEEEQQEEVLPGYRRRVETHRTKTGQKQGDERGRSKNFLTMPAAQKIRLAMLGSASDRSQLVRDPKRIVAMAAIKSPKVTINEVLNYAASPAVHADVLRYISSNREWTRNYQIKLALIQNPKTPVGTALAFLNHLRLHDLKATAVNRNVPELVSSTAKKLIKARSQRQERKRRK